MASTLLFSFRQDNFYDFATNIIQNLASRYERQLHYQRDQVSLRELPQMINNCQDNDLKQIMINQYNQILKRQQIDRIKRDWTIIKTIEEPQEYESMTAITQNGFAINHIPNPTEKMILTAIEHDNPNNVDLLTLIFGFKRNYVFETLVNPSFNVKRRAIEINPKLIGCIDNPEESLQLIAIEKDLSLITSIKNPSNQVLCKVLRKDPTYVFSLNVRRDILYILEKESFVIWIYNSQDGVYKLIKLTSFLFLYHRMMLYLLR